MSFIRPALRLALFTLGGVGLLATPPSQASCGLCTCSVNSDQEVEAWQDALVTRLDVRYENSNQDQLRLGTRRVVPGQLPRDTVELRTLNQTLRLTGDVAVDRHWGFSLALPTVVDRTHAHTESEGGKFDAWTLNGIGDLKVLGRYQADADPVNKGVWGLKFGLKLPTGSTTRSNVDGTMADRSVQPGTGSTDAVLGAWYNQRLASDKSWYTAITVQQALLTRGQFQPAQSLAVDVGYCQRLDEHLSAVVQLNLQLQGHDYGAKAETNASGGTYLGVAPGLSYKLGPDTQAYGFLQLPVYQRVDDVQLTRNTGAVLGVSTRL